MGKPKGIHPAHKHKDPLRFRGLSNDINKKTRSGTTNKAEPIAGASHSKWMVLPKTGTETKKKKTHAEIFMSVIMPLLNNTTTFIPGEGYRPNFIQKSIRQPDKKILFQELLKSQVVKEAKEMFSPEEVDDVVFQQVEQTGKGFASLHQLCEKVLERGGKRINMNSSSNEEINASVDESQNSKTMKSIKDLLLCKICMDKEKDIVFQPCGHLTSCESCAAKITNCPICRTTIENVVKAYIC